MEKGREEKARPKANAPNAVNIAVMAHPVPPAAIKESGSPENWADQVTRGFPSH
jgi:hypothetical protein